MLRVQFWYLTLNSGSHSHFCHSAYVTWSDVEFWSAHMPSRLFKFLLAHTFRETWRTSLKNKLHTGNLLDYQKYVLKCARKAGDTPSSRHVSSRDVRSTVGIFNIEFCRTLTLLSLWLRHVIWRGGLVGSHASTPLKFLLAHTFRETW
jgi:hypothetical protein